MLEVLDEAHGVSFCAHGGQQVNDEGKDVKGENEGNDPFEDGGYVLVVAPVGGDEDDSENELDDDECHLDPERDAEDFVMAVICYSILVNLIMKLQLFFSL